MTNHITYFASGTNHNGEIRALSLEYQRAHLDPNS